MAHKAAGRLRLAPIPSALVTQRSIRSYQGLSHSAHNWRTSSLAASLSLWRHPTALLYVAVKLALGIIIFDDLKELDAAGPYEVFAAAAGMRAGLLDVFLVAETTQPVRCVNGMRIVPHYSFVTAPSIDILLIPGGVGTRAQAGRSADPAFAREVQKYIEYYPAPPYTHET